MTDIPHDQRLTARVHAIWKKLAKTGFPRRSQIDPKDFGADWPSCLMIDIDPVTSLSRFSYVGNALRDPTWPTFDRQSVSECLEGTLLELIAREIARVTAKKKPTNCSGSAQHDNNSILYRTVLLPLSETGERIDGLLAAISYREVSIEERSDSVFAAAHRTEPLVASKSGQSRNGAANE